MHIAPQLLFFASLSLPRSQDLYPWADNSPLPECIRENAKSQHWEDRFVFLPLRCMRDGAPGSFVELGAFTGIQFSNSLMLERCFGWDGVLVEGSPSNFAQLAKSGRRATMVHTAVCPGDDDGFVNFTAVGGDISGEPSTRTDGVKRKKRGSKHGKLLQAMDAGGLALVPCRSLDRILDAAGFSSVDVLFLDVEGAEAKVLQSVDASRFAMVVLEAVDAARHARDVEPQLLAKGFRRERRLEAQAWGSWNPVYVREPNGASSAPVLTRRCIECAAHKSCRDRYAEPTRLDWNASTPAAVPKIMEAPRRSG